MDNLKKILSSELSPYIEDANTKHAAVLVVIYGKDHKIIMTEKPKTMTQHAGEISFPGGKLAEHDENLLETAIRETKEEISLLISKEQIIGQLNPVRTRNSGYTIIPFVAIIDDVSSLNPNSEVEEILHIPIIQLLKTLEIDKDENHRALFEAYILKYHEKIIWGASARILKQISDIFKEHHLLS